MTLPLSKPQVGGTGWHTNYWQMVDLWNSIDERIRDAIGATLIAGVGLDMVVNDAGDSVTLNATAGADDESIQDMISTFLVAGNNVVLTYDDAGHTLTIDANSNSETIRDTIATALVAGSGITVTPDDPGNTITVASTVTQYTDEMCQDAVAAMAKQGWGIKATYTDATPELKIENRAFRTVPADHGYDFWTLHPRLATGSQVLVAGVIHLVRFRVFENDTIGNILVRVNTAGSSFSNTYVGIYDNSGTRLAQSADLTSAWAGTGERVNALTSSATVTADTDYVFAVLVGAATTSPALARNSISTTLNMGMTAPAFNVASFGSGLTALPSSIDFSTVSTSANLIEVLAMFKS